ncbi:MAG: Hsp20/alpha crystallin family protein [Burkholderiales bacterium]
MIYNVYGDWFARDLLGEFERMQRELDRALGLSSSIRGVPRGFPAMNVGSAPAAVEIYAFVPGVDPASLDVQIEKGVLTVSGERKPVTVPEKATAHINERFSGRFRRVVALADDVDANKVTAKYRDGVLRISIARKETAQPRRIAIQQ